MSQSEGSRDRNHIPPYGDILDAINRVKTGGDINLDEAVSLILNISHYLHNATTEINLLRYFVFS